MQQIDKIITSGALKQFKNQNGKSRTRPLSKSKLTVDTMDA